MAPNLQLDGLSRSNGFTQVATGRKTDVIGVVGFRTDGEFALDRTALELVLINWGNQEPTILWQKMMDMRISVSLLRLASMSPRLLYTDGPCSPLGRFLMESMRDLKRDLVPSSTVQGDGISAICIAIDMIMRYCKKLKYIRNIVLVTDGRGSFDVDGVDDICRQIKEERINLTVM